ncbi:MAG: GGDEF domain-containing protein [Desulfotignum sp.]|jgi:diguanylate cyclase (GGDEF)-like protein|nr:GGDEF domain-containing protein [Desulfotignum sp.]
MKIPADENNDLIQEQIKKLQSQKDGLIKELDALEERFEKTQRLYRRYMPIVLDVVGTGDTAFSKACQRLGQAFKKEASPEKMAYVFEQLKTAMIQDDIGPVPVKKKKGMLASFLQPTTDRFFEKFKEDYHEVLNKLRSTLEKKYVPRLDNILDMLGKADDTSDMSDIRESIFNLIFLYISDTSKDREKVTVFIREIVEKILDIETKLADSFEHTHSMAAANKGFETVLQTEMHQLQTEADVTDSLEELKRQVTLRLASIDNALSRKQMTDQAIRQKAEKNQHIFKTGFVKLRQELDEATRYSEKLEKKLHQDQLTGAYNRRAYDKKIHEEMERFKRYGTLFSLLIIDADRFKTINDRFGHAIGDRCLKEIIQRTLPLLRTNDMLARYGGEEFTVIMPETDETGARNVAEKIRQTIEKIEFLYKQETVRITVSIGVSQVKQGETTHQDLFERADVAVYKAKEKGRNQVQVY